VAVAALEGSGLAALLERAEVMLPDANFDEGLAWAQPLAVGGGSE
jgi:hypothetical protein